MLIHLPTIFIPALVSFFVALSLVITQRWHGKISMDGLTGIQKMHTIPTPRIGGLSIFAGVIAAWSVAAPEVSKILGILLLSGLPACVFGLAEDLTKKVSVLVRLLATMASGILGWLLTGYSLKFVGVPLLDDVLIWVPVSVLFTAVAVGGVANAINIIDGFNGLAGGFVVISLTGLGLLANSCGDFSLSGAYFAIAASMFGFLLMNWPLGKIFLGDGGSYFGGFCLAWGSVLLIERNTQVTAFVALLICIHPVVEVLFSIYRRRIKKLNPGHPDRLHLHSLVMRRVVSPLLSTCFHGNRNQILATRNSVTGLALVLMNLPNVMIAFWLAYQPALAALFCLLFAIGYVAIYVRLVLFRWSSPFAFLFVKPLPKHSNVS